ncbi:hypothetical protein JQX13_28515 [Archangium violaceum]|uniref:hypothetical protein n=1 Tax=Archangium violaceum TaxID=83451 RepID=UPI00193BE072|nr:hypothetical protein [Archangium violaceum]QRK04212.1 hypothetical protein JQX13_28515 [Archangium violaceum]
MGRFGAFPRPRSDITSRLCSRGLLEKTIRARLASNPRIELVERFEAETFRWDSSRRRILAALFVTMGDALCALNPVYGQGMTVSLLSALELGRQMAQGGRISQKRFNALGAGPWLTAAGEDLRVPGCTLENVSAMERLTMTLNSIVGDRVMLRATFDPDAHQRTMRVLHMVDPPSALLPLALPRVV